MCPSGVATPNDLHPVWSAGGAFFKNNLMTTIEWNDEGSLRLLHTRVFMPSFPSKLDPTDRVFQRNP